MAQRELLSIGEFSVLASIPLNHSLRYPLQSSAFDINSTDANTLVTPNADSAKKNDHDETVPKPVPNQPTKKELDKTFRLFFDVIQRVRLHRMI